MKTFVTYVLKKKLPTKVEMCKRAGVKSPKTLVTHLNYLKSFGYVVEPDEDDPRRKEIAYYLPELEEFKMYVPNDTVSYLSDNCKEHIFKIYIYLYQKFIQAQSVHKLYEFTNQEIGEHIGIQTTNYARGYEVINNALRFLEVSGLVSMQCFFDGIKPKKRLLSVAFTVKPTSIDEDKKQE